MAIKEKNKNQRWHTLARVILFYACTLIVIILAEILSESAEVNIAGQLSMFIATILSFFLVVIFTRWEKLKLNDVGIVPSKKSAPRFSIGFGIGLSIAIMQVMITLSFGHLQLNFVPEITMTEILLILLLYIFVGCREELVFRSYSLRSLSYSLTPFLALIIITAIFVIEHLFGGMTWQNAIIGSGTGAILFGLAALKTKGLALPLGLHVAFNFGNWAFGFKGRPGIWEVIVEKGYDTQVNNIGLAAYVFAMGLAIIGICIFYKKEKLF
ncbi:MULTISPECIES: CPBP family intramembrane glutamic endopeptidase [Flavobacteriaceae]|uniref:CPBP family intramembrane glutamic endopeptidase n=1 Tax=Flavobacteriaceae TaxID=49546 RepID=UPI001490C40C|nr:MULTISPECIES: CPBP family intramembrane glutamic endopeptidase [Allomuricauda]MDC6364863.1 CPBP family intramembrane metalloprotease [Muricauda sp. AC10]